MAIKITGGVKIPQGKFSVTSNSAPAWVTAAGTIGTEDEGTVVSFQFEASDPEQGTTGFTFSKNSGDFPAGLSMDSAGLLTGTASDVESDTTSNFNLRVTDNGGLFADEDFSMTIANVVPSGPQVFTWGYRNYGELGLNDFINRSSPVQVGTLTDWADIAGGGGSATAVKTDGTMWAWGKNSTNGKLGDGTVIDRSSPIQIGNLTTWAKVGNGNRNHMAIKTDGTLWSWGNNGDGQLGHGNTISRSSPVQVGGLNNWASMTTGGNNSSFAIKTDNTLWTWGDGSQGRLGQNNQTDYSSPNQVGSLSTWASVSAGAFHALALKTDGSLWAWGLNNDGQLGNDNTVRRSSPVQIGNLTDWAFISATISEHSHAIKTDGTLWSWGSNVNGRLGDGTTTTRSSPHQIGSLTDWASVYGGQNHTLAIKTDGTLWGWGAGNGGRLGLGNTTNYSSPSQIGSETDWIKVRANNGFSIGIRDIP